MKNPIACFTMLLAILVCSAAFAQDRNYEIRVGVGVSEILSPKEANDILSLGFSVGGGIGFFVKPQLTIGGNIYHNRSKRKNNNVALPDIVGARLGTSASILEILAVVQYYFKPTDETSTNVYVLGGAGVGRDKMDFKVSFQIPATETDGMITSGIGVKFGSSISFFVEGRIKVLFT